MDTLALNIDAQGIEWSARWIGWGKGRYHIQTPGAETTACGMEIPQHGLRSTIYSPHACTRCKKHDDLYHAAEEYRTAGWEYVQGLRDEKLRANQEGRFKVLRCKLCGVQHASAGDGRGAVAYCISSHHPAELEEVEAIGPAWTSGPSEGNQP